MNTMEQELENALRDAPMPAPPPGLKERLMAQVRLPALREVSRSSMGAVAGGGWLRRWWPVLAPAAVSLACAAGLLVQQAEIHDLQRALHNSSNGAANTGSPSGPTLQTNTTTPHADTAARNQQELARLKELAGQLTAEIAQLERLGAENTRLRAPLAAPGAGFLTAEENDEVAKIQEKTEAINCMNNMKQLGLAVRIWALDNEDPVTHARLLPPNVLEMTNEMGTPKILVCPGDHGRQPASDWKSYTTANCSYEYLAAGALDTESDRVLFRCPIHGHIGLCDGSVRSHVAKRHPELLVRKNGILYLPDVPPATDAVPTPQPDSPPPNTPPPSGAAP